MPNQSEHDRYSFYYNRCRLEHARDSNRHGLREIVFLEDPLATFAADFYQYRTCTTNVFQLAS